MADDPWGEAGAQPGGVGGYLSDADFHVAMDATFGKGKWRDTGGFRSQAREAQLRAQGAATVAPGHVSAHSVGEEGAPGAHDIVADGLTPQQTAERIRARSPDLFAKIYPEAAQGGQGAHVHLATAPGTQGGDPWAEGSADPWAEKKAGGGFIDQVERKAGSLLGGVISGVGKVVKGAAEAADVSPLFHIGENITAAQEGRAPAEHQTSEYVAPITQGLDAWGEAVAPADRTPAESFLHGAGEFVAPLGAAVVAPESAPLTFGAQGYGTGYQEAKAKGADEATARAAAAGEGVVQAAVGVVPVGELTGPLAAGLKAGVARFTARLGLNVLGDAGLGAAMQTGSNLVAQQTYDPQRPWYDQVPQSAAMMAAGGLVVHGVHEAVGAVKGRLRPAEAPPGSAPDAATIPETNAIRAYAGKGPVEPDMGPPETSQETSRGAATGRSAPGPITTGDYVLFDAGRNPTHGRVIGDETVEGPGGEPQRMLVVRTPVGEALVPADHAIALPGDFEGARIEAGAPLEQMPQAISDVAELRRAAPKGYSVLQAIRDLGGIRTKRADGETTEVGDMLSGQRLAPGTVNNKTGMYPDAMREALQQRGWFGTIAPDPARPAGEARGDTLQDFLDLFDKGLRQRVLHPDAAHSDARRKDLESQMARAGAGVMTDPLPQAAAKLAAWRGEQVKQRQPDMALLHKRADDLGVSYAKDASYDELLGDVVEREAVRGEATAADADHYEGLIDAELTPEEHEWLVAGPRGAEGEPGPTFEAEGAPGRDEEPAEEEGGGQPGQGAAGGGEDQAEAGAEPVDDAEAVKAGLRQGARQVAAARRMTVDRFDIKKNKGAPSTWTAEQQDFYKRQLAEIRRAEAKGNIPENIAANDFRKAEMERAAAVKAADFVDTFPPELERDGRPKATDLEHVKTIHEETARAVVQDLLDAEHYDHMEAQGLDPATGKPPTEKRKARIVEERAEIADAISDTLDTYQDHFGEAARQRFEIILRDRAYDQSAANREPAAEPEPRRGRPRKRRGLNRSEREDREIEYHRDLSTRRARELLTPPDQPPSNPLEDAVRDAEARVRAAPRGAARVKAARELAAAKNALDAWRGRQVQRPAPSPAVERQDIGGETVQQQLLAGGERSAMQAAKAREGPLRAKVAQRDAGDLFGAPAPQASDLFAKDPWQETEKPPARDIAATPEARQTRAEAETPRGEGYGDRNKVFSREAADAARKKLAELNRRSSSGIDPEMIHAGITLAGYHVEAGARRFGDYAAAMVRDLGEWAEPFLKMWYNALRDYPSFDAAGMTPADKLTDAAVAEALANVRRGSPDLEPGGEGAAAADADGAVALPTGPGEAERGAGSPGTGAAAAGLQPEGGDGLPDRRASPVGEGGPGDLFARPSGDERGPAGGREPSGSDVARDAGIQPDRIGPADLDRASDEAAHLDPVAAGAHPDAEAPNAPPVPHDVDEALPTLFPEQRADVAFAELRFKEPDGHGVMFTNGTGTGKTYVIGGIAKRVHDRGKTDILILAPTQGILNAHIEAAEQLGYPLKILDGVEDNGGSGPVATTYANLAANRSLARRAWDAVIADESHSLSSDMDGSETQALAHFRAITNHPDRLERKAEMLMPKEVDRVERLRKAIPEGAMSGPAWDKWATAARELHDKVRAKAAEIAKEPRAKAAFLSATPFAYDKSIDYAQGYLFDYPATTGRGYNDPADGRDAFMIDHFGYRMRYGKLTKPEAGVETDVMERQFHEWLRRKGALSGRVLTVDKDYDRRFALVDGGVGQKIDDALTFLREADDGRFAPLADVVWKRFDYLSRMRLLEAIKAKAAIPRIRAHQALGRKVVVFHNYNEGGGFNPFDALDSVDGRSRPGERVDARALAAEFYERNPGIKELGQEIQALGSPLEQLQAAFPEALVYNGNVPKARRAQSLQAFNRDGSPYNLVIVQSEAGQAGISLHDTTGKHQRAIENLGLPGRPVAAIQQEGRIYRIGQASDAIFRYLNTGTNWERHAFATTIAQRAGTAENLALGDQARTMRDSFINAFLDSAANPPARGEGRGGKAADRDLAKALTEFQRAKSFYFAEGKKTGRQGRAMGNDYFATPEPVGLKMVEWADIRLGDKVLEPSAGHGAIARFFPETADRTLVEPSSQLASRASLSSPGANVLEHRFEDLHPVNKYDAVVMNPPFGHAGATAVDHIKRAAGHLRDGGRIVAVVPRGAADAKIEAFMESRAADGLYEVASIDMPASTFERAGTKVSTRILVLEKQMTAAGRDGMPPTRRYDLSDAANIGELFDRMEHSTLPERTRPAAGVAEPEVKFQVERPEPQGDLFQGVEPITERPTAGPFAKAAPDTDRAHFDQNHADLYRLAQHVGTAEQRKAEAQRLATEMGQFMDWGEDEAARLTPEGTPRAADMMRAAKEYAAEFNTNGKSSFYDADAYHDVMRRWYEHQGGERPKFQRGEPGEGFPIFYSAVERLVDNAPMRSASPGQWRATLKNAPGIKQEELGWLGVNDWLDLFPAEERVSKEAVAAFVREHGVKVEERVLPAEPDHEAIRTRAGELHGERVGELTSQYEDAEFDSDDAVENAERDANGEYGEFLDRAEEEIPGAPSQFEDWTLHGGKNYRELLLTLPQIERPPATHWDTEGVMAHVRFNERQSPDGKKVLFVEEIQSDWHQKGRDQGYSQGSDPVEVDRLTRLLAAHRANLEAADARLVAAADAVWDKQHPEYPPPWRGRFLHPNPSSRALAIKGWYDGLDANVAKRGDEIEDALSDSRVSQLQVREVSQQLDTARQQKGIPDAPFKTSWPALVMKRVIRWAVDNGFERVAWTTGEQQADRYDLTKHVGRVTFGDNSAGGTGEPKLEGPETRGTLRVFDIHGSSILERHIGDARDGSDTRRDLEEHIGRELTDRLLAAPGRSMPGPGGWRVRERELAGLDVKIGGEGMRAFYDRNLVNITNDLIKKHGGKVGKTKIEHPDIADLKRVLDQREGILRGAESRTEYRGDLSREQDEKYIEQLRQAVVDTKAQLAEAENGQDQHGFDLNDKLREAVRGGQPLFQRPGQPHVGFAGRGAHLVADLYGVPADAKGSHADAIRAVAEAIAKVAPHAKVKAFDRLTDAGYWNERDKSVIGATYRRGPLHVIAWSLETPDAMHTAHHEAVHALRNAGLFTAEEWKTLEQAAVDQDWMGKYGITDRWGQLPYDQELEEAIAERFANWQSGDGVDVTKPLDVLFGRIKAVLAGVAAAMRRLFGAAATAEDILRKISEGEVGRRALKSGETPTVKFQRKSADNRGSSTDNRDEEPKGPARFIARALGAGVDAVGHKLARAAEKALPDPVLTLADEAKMALSPMGSGSARAQAAAKDFANELRTSAYQWDKVDKWLVSRFSTEQQQQMWLAADEEGVLQRRGAEPGPDQGMNRLTPDERAAVVELQRRADEAFATATRLDMVRGDGLESYVPRMVVQMTAGGPRILARGTQRQAARGGNLSTTTGQLRQRKYETTEETEAAAQRAFGSGAMVVRNIRTLVLATQRLERAIAGRVLVDKIKAMSGEAGADLVVDGGSPDGRDYFTLDHPALQRWGPKFITDKATGKTVAATDQNDDTVFQATPIWISREFEGPLKAVLSQPTSGIVRALGDLKGKMMSVIMYSPLMHNAVIWGKAIPADPRGVLSLQVYRRGYAAKQDQATMEEAMRAGLDPIGRRFFNQDLTSIAEAGQIVPGRSWTSQVLAFVPGLFDPAAADAVKRGVDKAGDLWHNTFLWDRVADLQMGLYVHIRDQLARQGNTTGIGAKDAQRVAAHFANRYAGALPMEGMSKLARETANLLLFSRSFTLGNLGAYKDIVKGMPSDVRSQVLIEGGVGALERVQGAARRKALVMMTMDVALSYAGLFLAAAATAWLTHQKFQAPQDNEADRTKRFLIGYQPDGTAIYGRLPTGKVGEELQDWATEPRDILLRKLSPYGRLIYAIAANDKGFGRKLFQPDDPLMKNAARVGWFAMQGVAPVGQLQGASDAFTGAQDRKTALLQALAPIAGVTVSKGAPGGPLMSDYYRAKDAHDFAVQEAMPEIRRMIHAGDVTGARAKMKALGIAPGLENFYVRTALAPGGRLKGRALADFMRYATREQKAQVARDRAAAQARAQDVTP